MWGIIELLLRQQGLTKEDVKDVLLEYHDNIGTHQSKASSTHQSKVKGQSKCESDVGGWSR
ncbi:hypothetical protein IEQ34_006762 [Dendrobium chrysotoxum]|uniref:Uncharacterized protein n=1 Tax=Dendrobium chrysotoxum TaxID=161865 RepID=A0AAV7H4G4_DENCH|nr:hypothetical protein IEQ34_006762 [Dendrobium chrysotoxum]